MAAEIILQLRKHAPFTALGTATGIAIMLVMSMEQVPRHVSETLFWTLHPLHVLVSALVTVAMYRLHAPGRLLRTILIGYVGSVGIATLSDSIIPFAGEWLFSLPHRAVHIGFIEKWWLVNPLALLGIAIGMAWPHTRFPHAAHVFLSTWTSLFHMTMALGGALNFLTVAGIGLFLFLAVWIPCCTSDIVFPLIWIKADKGHA
ncbi:MAG: hypothetical protein JXA24_07735 [Proteobacteria bacterium]|nr:hypothetical protein [Pseudomonadota bacterium]